MVLLPLSIPITLASYYRASTFRVLLNWLICLISNIQVHLFGAVYVAVEPTRMIYGGFSTPQELQMLFDLTCCLSYGLCSHAHACGRSLPPEIRIASRGG